MTSIAFGYFWIRHYDCCMSADSGRMSNQIGLGISNQIELRFCHVTVGSVDSEEVWSDLLCRSRGSSTSLLKIL